MGQTANQRRVKDNEAMAMAKFLRTSPQKLNLICQTIRGKNAGKAMIDLEFNNRRVSQDVRKVLQSAVANAENNHNLDVDRLVVSEAFVGKSITMKRFRARARGRGARILKPFSRLTIIVREQTDDVKAKPASKKAVKSATKGDNKNKTTISKADAKKSPAKAKKDVKTPNKTAEKKPAAGKPATNDPAHTNAKDVQDPKQAALGNEANTPGKTGKKDK